MVDPSWIKAAQEAADRVYASMADGADEEITSGVDSEFMASLMRGDHLNDDFLKGVK